MMSRRWAMVALSLAAALSLTTAACGSSGPDGDTTDQPELTAEQLVAAAGEKMKGQPVAAVMKWGMLLDAQGVQDGSGKNAKLSMKMAEPESGAQFQADMILLGNDMWLKMDFGALGQSVPQLALLGSKWMHIDSRRLPARMTLGLRPGSAAQIGADGYLKSITKVEKVSPTALTGQLDLTKSTATGISADVVKQLGAKAKTIPFIATLDGEGRLARLVLKMPAVAGQPAGDLSVEYSGVGTAPKITRPAAADTIAAPETLYQMFG